MFILYYIILYCSVLYYILYYMKIEKALINDRLRSSKVS